jgi:hypothetical protein
MRQQQEAARQALLAIVEELIDKILFIADAPAQQVGHQEFGNGVLILQHIHQDRAIDSDQRAVGERAGSGHPDVLAGQASFAEDFPGFRQGEVTANLTVPCFR